MNEGENRRSKFGRLIVVAGFRGSGKSTFLIDRGRCLRGPIPEGLQGWDRPGVEEAGVTSPDELGPEADVTCHDEPEAADVLLLHADLMVPLLHSEERPHSRNDLLGWICADRYRTWKPLEKFIDQADKVVFVTLFVRQRVHLERWIGREYPKLSQSSFDILVASVHADPWDKSALHRSVFGAWHDFASSVEGADVHVLDANQKPYLFMPEADFLSEIRGGYLDG